MKTISSIYLLSAKIIVLAIITIFSNCGRLGHEEFLTDKRLEDHFACHIIKELQIDYNERGNLIKLISQNLNKNGVTEDAYENDKDNLTINWLINNIKITQSINYLESYNVKDTTLIIELPSKSVKFSDFIPNVSQFNREEECWYVIKSKLDGITCLLCGKGIYCSRLFLRR
jgi:hypothetical protein